MSLFPIFSRKRNVEQQIEQVCRESASQTQALQQTIVSTIRSEIQVLQQNVISAMLSEIQTVQQGLFHEIQSIEQNIPQFPDILRQEHIKELSKQTEDVKALLFQLIPPDIDKVDLNTWHTVYMQRMLSFIKVLEELNDTKQKTEQLFSETERIRTGVLAKAHVVMENFLLREQTTDPIKRLETQPPEPA